MDYRERIGAVYAQVSGEIGRWGYQVGLRNEYSDIGVEQLNDPPRVEGAEEVPADFRKRYNNLFPSATISRELSERWSANVSYTSRIRRPGF